MEKRKRLIALFLCALMTLLPIPAFADDAAPSDVSDIEVTEGVEPAAAEEGQEAEPTNEGEPQGETPADPSQNEGGEGSGDEQPSADWIAADFTFEGGVVTGLSESGIAKRSVNKNLVIPAETPDGVAVTEIGAAGTTPGGLFATADEKFDTVTLPAGITKIGANAFRESGISAINFPEGLKEIGNSAFLMNNLEEINLPDTLTSLGGGAFSTNKPLKSVHIPENPEFTEIPASAFAWSNQGSMENFTSVTIPSNITKIGMRAFAGNAFTSVEIPGSVVSLENYCFSQPPAASKLETIILNEGIETIKQYAFDNCKAKTVVLPASVQTLNANAFRAQTERDKVQVITPLALDELPAGVAKTSNHHVIVSAAEWTAADFTFEGGVVTGLTEVGAVKRSMNKNLVIPAETSDGAAVTEIGAAGTTPGGLFATRDEKLETVTLPAGITKIGANAFRESGISEINFPEGLKEIGNFAFQMNNLVEVNLPDTVTTLGNGVFTTNQTLKSVHIPENSELTAIPASTFAWSNQGCMENFTELTIPSNITSIGDRAFAGAAFTSIEIPATVKTLGRNCFAQPMASARLETIVLNEGLETINQYAFDNCIAASVALPTTVQTLNANAFRSQNPRDKVKVVTPLALDALPSGVAKTSNYHEIVTAEEFAEEVTEEIQALPATVSKADKAAVTKAREAYNSLVQAGGEEYVSDATVAKLEAAEARINNLEAQEALAAAEEALAAAQAAQEASEEAQAAAEAAQAAAETAQKAAEEAQKAAEEAQQKAEAAEAAAAKDKEDAEAAQKAAEEALKDAQEAQAAAAEAQNKAEAAQAAAGASQQAAIAAQAETKQMLLDAKYTPGKVNLKKAVRGKKKATLTWKTIKSNVTGYEIEFTNKSTGEVVKVVQVKQTKKMAKKSKIKKAVKKLKKGKYKVRVRAYNIAEGQTFYGAWSKTKNVKVR